MSTFSTCLFITPHYILRDILVLYLMLFQINSLQKNNTNPCRKPRIIQRFYSRYFLGLQATISRTYYERTPLLKNGDKRTVVITYFLSQTFPTFIKLCLFYKLKYFSHIALFFLSISCLLNCFSQAHTTKFLC